MKVRKGVDPSHEMPSHPAECDPGLTREACESFSCWMLCWPSSFVIGIVDAIARENLLPRCVPVRHREAPGVAIAADACRFCTSLSQRAPAVARRSRLLPTTRRADPSTPDASTKRVILMAVPVAVGESIGQTISSRDERQTKTGPVNTRHHMDSESTLPRSEHNRSSTR